MIIQCDNCHTRYKIDKSKVKEKGVKVKCKKCENIFIVKRPRDEERQVDVGERGASLSREPLPHEKTIGEKEELSQGTSEREGEGLPWTIEGGQKGPTPEETPTIHDEDREEPGEKTSSGIDDEFNFTFETSKDELKSLKESMEMALPETERIPREQAVDYDKERSKEFDEEDSAMGEIMEEEEESRIEGEDETEITEETPVKSSSFWGSPLKRIVVFILLLIILAGIGLTFTGTLNISIFQPIKHGLDRIFESLGLKSQEVASLELIGLKGYYQRNIKAGILFVVEGRIVNPSNTQRKIERLKGSIFDRAGNPYQEKPIYPGRILLKSQLSELSIEEIENDLHSDVQVLPPGQFLPFMVVFYRVPRDLSEFLVEIEG